MNIHILVIVTLVTVISSCQALEEPNCENWRDDIDKASSILFVAGDRDLIPAKNLIELEDRYCKRHTDAIEKVRNITKTCLRPFPQQVIGLLTFGSRKEVRKTCKHETEKQRLLDSVRCFIPKENMEILHDSFDDLIVRVETIRDSNIAINSKMSHTCCAYNSYIRHLRNLFRDKCSITSLDYILDMTDKKVKEAFDFTCLGYSINEMDKCNELNKREPIYVDPSAKPKSKSIILPLVDIYTAEDESRPKSTSIIVNQQL